MNKEMLIAAIIPSLIFGGCKAGQEIKEQPQTAVYQQISAQEAKNMMDEMEEVLILDVREQSEYDCRGKTDRRQISLCRPSERRSQHQRRQRSALHRRRSGLV